MNTFAFSTSQYEAMREFFLTLGFTIDDNAGQLCPLFEKSRGCIASFGDIEFNLEESTTTRMADFNLIVYADSEYEPSSTAIARYNPIYEEGFYGKFLTFTSPDGGRITIRK